MDLIQRYIRKMTEYNQERENAELFSNEIENDIIPISNDMEDEEMASKFYNFQCIILYGYIDYTVAQTATNNYVINTPIELFESSYIAKLFAPKTGTRQLMAFAVWVQNNVYDEFDLSLAEKIKNDCRILEEIKKSVSVIRNLKSYKVDEKKKGKPYISYTIQNQNAIKQIFPI